MAKAIGYVRVGKSEQTNMDIALESQESKIRAYAELNDLELVYIARDGGKSGKDMNREGLQQFMGVIESGEVDTAIVYQLDRLSRKVLDVLMLIEKINQTDINFHSIKEKIDTRSTIGKVFLTVVTNLADMERDNINERAKRLGDIGGVSYGYKIIDAQLAEVCKLCDVISWTRKIRERGGKNIAVHGAVDIFGEPLVNEVFLNRQDAISYRDSNSEDVRQVIEHMRIYLKRKQRSELKQYADSLEDEMKKAVIASWLYDLLGMEDEVN